MHQGINNRQEGLNRIEEVPCTHCVLLTGAMFVGFPALPYSLFIQSPQHKTFAIRFTDSSPPPDCFTVDRGIATGYLAEWP